MSKEYTNFLGQACITYLLKVQSAFMPAVLTQPSQILKKFANHQHSLSVQKRSGEAGKQNLFDSG